MTSSLALVLSVVALAHSFMAERTARHCEFLYVKFERLEQTQDTIRALWEPYRDIHERATESENLDALTEGERTLLRVSREAYARIKTEFRSIRAPSQ